MFLSCEELISSRLLFSLFYVFYYLLLFPSYCVGLLFLEMSIVLEIYAAFARDPP